MKTTLKKIKDIKSEDCISIVLNTHRSKPDYLKDEIQLKNLIKVAESKLAEKHDKKATEKFVQEINSLAKNIDHGHNLESLLLFINVTEGISEYVRLPVAVKDRVVIDDTFATRDLIRYLNSETNYLVLILSQEKARLIEVLNDNLVQEFKAPFPYVNRQFYAKNKTEHVDASKQTSLVAEFFNQVDKEVNIVRKTRKLPVLVCSVEENYFEYLKIVDDKPSVFDFFINTNQISKKGTAIAKASWEVMEGYVRQKNESRKEELLKAVSENTFLSDTNEIWRAINEGRIQTLFIEEGLFQKAIMTPEKITYLDKNDDDANNVVDDIYDDMIEVNMDFGGDVVFLPKGELKDFNGFGAITRF